MSKYIMMVALIGLVGCGGPDQIDPCDAGPEWAHLCGTGGEGGEGGEGGAGGEGGTGGTEPEDCTPVSAARCNTLDGNGGHPYYSETVQYCAEGGYTVVEECEPTEWCVYGNGTQTISDFCQDCGKFADRYAYFLVEGPDGWSNTCDGCTCARGWIARYQEYPPESGLPARVSVYWGSNYEVEGYGVTGQVSFALDESGAITTPCEDCLQLNVVAQPIKVTKEYANDGTFITTKVEMEMEVQAVMQTDQGSIIHLETRIIVDQDGASI